MKRPECLVQTQLMWCYVLSPMSHTCGVLTYRWCSSIAPDRHLSPFPFFLTGIRQLQLILFKVALMLGVEIHVNVEFVRVLEPPEDQENQSTV